MFLMTNSSSGILIVDKPQGLTSQQVVSRLKHHFKIKKAGHTGTLDPLATGVLPVAFCEATKVIPYLEEEKKVYQVEGKLGEATDTLDAEGKVVAQGDASKITKALLAKALEKLTGEIIQTPPLYSAIKVKGRALYTYARQGKTPEHIPERKVQIHQLKLTGWEAPFFTLEVYCSRGTYVRSLVHDIGADLGCFAHMTQLRRLQSGPFLLSESVPWEKLQEASSLEEFLGAPAWQDLRACVKHLPWMELDHPEEARLLSHGVPLQGLEEVLIQKYQVGEVLAVGYQETLVTLVKLTEEKRLKILRTFNLLKFPQAPPALC